MSMRGTMTMRKRVAAWVGAVVLAASTAQAQGQDPAGSPMAHDMSWGRTTFVLTEVLELAPDAPGRPLMFDVIGWTGGASRRVWFKLDGESATQGAGVDGDLQVLYGRLVSPWWDAQIGVRADFIVPHGTRSVRAGAVVGVQGLAPGWFEVEPSLFLTTDGKLSLNMTASYDLYLTQRLVLQPRVETSLAAQDDVDFGIGQGVGPTNFGLRTRYEFAREFAPYAGVVWERRYGRTAELAGDRGGEPMLVAGLRLWW